jgi:subtilisin-like proprotein convertase family protein
MKTNKLFTIVTLLMITISFSQTEKAWKETKNFSGKVSKNVSRQSFPTTFSLFELNIETVKVALLNTPLKSYTARVAGRIVSFPNTEGNVERFEVFEQSNFDPILQSQFPDIRSYSGIGIDDKHAQIRFSLDSKGIQAMIFRVDKRNEFIEPYTEDGKFYAVYNSSRVKGSLPFSCSTIDHAVATDVNRTIETNRSNSGELLTFRLALSCNGEYTAYFGGTVANALAAMNATMTRVNGVFEKDFAIHMNIIANTTSVIYTNAANDPYSSLGNWNGELQGALTATIGEANYDVGHMFGATGGGGNAGCIGCVCVDGQKGSGITSPADGIPAGDTFDIDYVAHELGHQFGGNHTFSQNVEGSGVNVEPGSGSTIMGYAGITAQDVQPNSDDYFVYASIKQVQDNMVGKTCPVRTPLTNGAPVVNAGLDYFIPKSTPFILTGTATDPNGDVLSYCWEQNDTATTQTGAASAASATKTGGPNWRSYDPVSSPLRFCPPIARVIANATTTQGTEIVVEALNSVARTLNFVLTARDNVADVGQTGSDSMTVTVVNTLGTVYSVTAPNTNVSWPVASNQSVTWNVGGTTASPISATYVDIFLSTDGGFTYPIQLASKVPNDGSETITIPNNIGTTNRIMVKGYKHIFYDISNANFAIVASSPAATFSASFNGVAESQNKEACTGASVSYNISYAAFGGFSGTTSFSVTGQPAGSTVTFSPTTISSNGTVTMTISNTGSSAPGLYSMIVTATSGAITKTVPFYFNLFSSNFPSSTLSTPVDLAIGQTVGLNLTWVANANATLYDVQVASDNAFTNIVSSGTVSTNIYAVTGLAEGTNYYWRVLPKNSSCSGVYSAPFQFTTGVVVCSSYTSANVPLTILTTANVTINSTLNVPNNVTISDVNVTVNVSHTWVNDLTMTLISPNGTQVQLVAAPCASASLLNIVGTFDDSGAVLVCGTDPAISGTVKPIQLLSAFNGQASQGTWTLRILDSFNQDGGSLNSWSINLCNTQPLSTNEITLQDFALFPNPNKGNFTVQFNSTSNNEIKIDVYDISGRRVFENNYENTGLFSQNIQLNNLQSGVYLVNVQDGNTKEVKRIIIE